MQKKRKSLRSIERENFTLDALHLPALANRKCITNEREKGICLSLLCVGGPLQRSYTA